MLSTLSPELTAGAGGRFSFIIDDPPITAAKMARTGALDDHEIQTEMNKMVRCPLTSRCSG